MKDRKDDIIIATAILTLSAGISMSFLSFSLSDNHTIASSVLWFFGQCLLYTASALGIYGYVRYKGEQLNNLIKNNQHQ